LVSLVHVHGASLLCTATGGNNNNIDNNN